MCYSIYVTHYRDVSNELVDVPDTILADDVLATPVTAERPVPRHGRVGS
jgi:hypothetical protein